MFVSPARLDRQNPKRTQVTLQEGKTPWVYTTADYQDILRGSESIIDAKGNFLSIEDPHRGNLLMKQVSVTFSGLRSQY